MASRSSCLAQQTSLVTMLYAYLRVTSRVTTAGRNDVIPARPHERPTRRDFCVCRTPPQGVHIYSLGLKRDEYGAPAARKSFPGMPVEPIPAFVKGQVVIQELLELGIAAKKGFDPDYNERIHSMGLGGANQQNQFTIACLLTHRRVWQQMVANSVPMALVLEADQFFVPRFDGDTAYTAGTRLLLCFLALCSCV